MKAEEKKAYLYLLITFFLWGSLYVVSKIVLTKLTTFTVAFGRYLIAFIALSIMAKKMGTMKIAKEDYKYIAIIGFLGYCVSVTLQLMGTKLAGSSIASLINSMNPITISLMGALILKEKLTANKIVGILLSLVGVYFIIGTGSNINIPGALLSILAVVGWSFMSVITRKVSRKYDALTVTRAAIGITVICDLPLCIYDLTTTTMAVQFDFIALAGLCYIGIMCTALTLVLWNKSLAALPASVCSAFYPVQTLTSSTIGILLFHEAAGFNFFAGTILIIAGVLISLLLTPKNA